MALEVVRFCDTEFMQMILRILSFMIVSGILSLFCAKAGAKKVYAVEASSLAEVLPQVALANEYQDVIEVRGEPGTDDMVM